ncbi:hypothetical protein T01_12197 [Trichinella spiralis]|uniref:Uncharacterized protein n=1 Tax=Trichinella spiralis TaxID=6334 RepID=A0A0V0YYK3_TRISP|nr:hypothetical protein T01_13111 [Trichinella spiralis]KRY14502.1 hypothetical protein T01_12197 [Trichinella spiralis]
MKIFRKPVLVSASAFSIIKKTSLCYSRCLQ